MDQERTIPQKMQSRIKVMGEEKEDFWRTSRTQGKETAGAPGAERTRCTGKASRRMQS